MKDKMVEITYSVSVRGCMGRVIEPDEDYLIPAWKIFITDAELEKKVGKKWKGFNIWTIPTTGFREL